MKAGSLPAFTFPSPLFARAGPHASPWRAGRPRRAHARTAPTEGQRAYHRIYRRISHLVDTARAGNLLS